jgi:hypothetical protein
VCSTLSDRTKESECLVLFSVLIRQHRIETLTQSTLKRKKKCNDDERNREAIESDVHAKMSKSCSHNLSKQVSE